MQATEFSVTATSLSSVATERDERAAFASMAESVQEILLPRIMQELSAPPTAALDSAEHPPRRLCGSSPALSHPGLRSYATRVRALGYRLCLDESLRGDAAHAQMAPRRVQELIAFLGSVGGYFSPARRCIGLAVDSAWHEAVHEMVHLSFDARVRRVQGAEADAKHPTSDPLWRHYQQLRNRGYTPRTAEEMMCREHELRALVTSSAPPWRWCGRALLVWDNGLLEAERELTAVAPAQRTRAQSVELERVSWLRRRITGPTARLQYLLLLGVGVTLALSTAARRLPSWRGSSSSRPSPALISQYQ